MSVVSHVPSIPQSAFADSSLCTREVRWPDGRTLPGCMGCSAQVLQLRRKGPGCSPGRVQKRLPEGSLFLLAWLFDRVRQHRLPVAARHRQRRGGPAAIPLFAQANTTGKGKDRNGCSVTLPEALRQVQKRLPEGSLFLGLSSIAQRGSAVWVQRHAGQEMFSKYSLPLGPTSTPCSPFL